MLHNFLNFTANFSKHLSINKIMIPIFENLNKKEIDLLLNAPVMVTILVAGADNFIDTDEQEGAIKMTKYRQFTEDKILHDYYSEVYKNFEKNLKKFVEYINSFPSDAKDRNPYISNELSKLNELMPKLDKKFAYCFYESLKSFAKHIAESSGGILGYGSISSEEKEWVELKMINKPAIPEDLDKS